MQFQLSPDVFCIHFYEIDENEQYFNNPFSINFWDINLIFDSGKSWNCIFWDGKVFYPLLTSWKSAKLKNLKIRFVASSAQKGGKKLSEGVKNFFMIKSNVSAFSWTKNHTFIWQTHSYSSDQKRAVKCHLGVRSGVSPLKKKFFTPPTSFLPPFYEFEFPSQIRFSKSKKYPKIIFFKKRG